MHGHRYGPVTTVIPDLRGDSEDGKKVKGCHLIKSATENPDQHTKVGQFQNRPYLLPVHVRKAHNCTQRNQRKETRTRKKMRPQTQHGESFKAPKSSTSNNRKTSGNPTAALRFRYEWSHQLYRSSPTNLPTYPLSPSPSMPSYPSRLLRHSLSP